MTLLAQSTRIAVHVVVQDDTGRVATLLLAITSLIGLCLYLWHFLLSVAMLVNDTAQAIDFTLKVFTIGLKAAAYGAGVNV